MISARHIVVTGAAGFIGGKLVARLLQDARLVGVRFSFNDRQLPDYDDIRVRAVPGDLREGGVRGELIDGRADIVFHVAGLLGGAAEADPILARTVNIDASLLLLEALHDMAAPPRVVFASSIAVFGAPFPPMIDDDMRPMPLMLYGAQKLMIETAVEQASGRGWIDGLALRLPGVVARPGADARLKSAFLNAVFHAFADGRDFILPVSPDGTIWLLSASACVDALIHAALLPPERLGRRRAFTLPAQNISFGDLVRVLAAHFPDNTSHITYEPDEALQAQFGSQPPLATPLADSLGFQHDGDLATLVARAFD